MDAEYYKEYLDHVPDGVSKEIEDYVTNTVFENSRYIFTTREDGKETGYCTHCKAEFETNKLKHNAEHICPCCGSKCTVKQAWRGHKSLQDEACFIWYEKSLIDPTILVARGFHVWRYYGADYKNVCNKYNLEAVYIFGDKPQMLKYSYWGGGWNLTKSIYSFNINYLAKHPYYYSYENINKAMKGTKFKYCPYKEFKYYDMLKFFELYYKYPIIEQLTKVGMKGLVCNKLDGGLTYNAINWRGKDIFKVLKINRKDLKDIKNANIQVTPLFLHLYQESKKKNANLTPEQCKTLEHHVDRDFEGFLEISKHTNLRKIVKYIEKQELIPELKRTSYNSIFYTWKDYLKDCKKLKLDTNNESTFFPKNLYNAHQNTIKQIKYIADKELEIKMKNLSKYRTEKYCFEYQGLLIRPAGSTKELIAEGKALEHCVGGYADRYANGSTDILFIRKLSEPDKPYYTMEVLNNRINQTRGLKNCAPNDEVKEFLGAFTKAKLEGKSKTKVKIPA